MRKARRYRPCNTVDPTFSYTPAYSQWIVLPLTPVVWLLTGHYSATDFSHWSAWSINPDNVFLFGLIVFAYIGTESPLNMADEIREGQEHLIVKRHLFWGGLIIFLVYMLNTIAVLLVLGQNGTVAFALVTMVDMVLGKVVGNITGVSAGIYSGYPEPLQSRSRAKPLLLRNPP